MTDVYPAGLDWVPDWSLSDDERLPWYHDLSSVLRAGPVRATLQMDYDEEVAFQARRVLVDAAREPSRPLLLVASFTHPHDPYEVPARLLGSLRRRRDPAAARSRRRRSRPTRPRAGCARWSTPTARRCRPSRSQPPGAAYRGGDHAGRRARWRRCSRRSTTQGLRDDTVVVVTSDHGDMLGERGLWYKMAPFEPSIRVPLIVSGPGIGRGRRVAQPVSLLDLAPTLVELGGGSVDDDGELDGRSFAGALRGDPLPRARRCDRVPRGGRAVAAGDARARRAEARSARSASPTCCTTSRPIRTSGTTSPAIPSRAAELAALAARGRPALGPRAARCRRCGRARRAAALVAAALATGAVTAWDHAVARRRREPIHRHRPRLLVDAGALAPGVTPPGASNGIGRLPLDAGAQEMVGESGRPGCRLAAPRAGIRGRERAAPGARRRRGRTQRHDGCAQGRAGQSPPGRVGAVSREGGSATSRAGGRHGLVPARAAAHVRVRRRPRAELRRPPADDSGPHPRGCGCRGIARRCAR